MRFQLFFLRKKNRKIAFSPLKKIVKKSNFLNFFRAEMQDLVHISTKSKRKSKNSPIPTRTNPRDVRIFQLREVISRRNRRFATSGFRLRPSRGGMSFLKEYKQVKNFWKIFVKLRKISFWGGVSFSPLPYYKHFFGRNEQTSSKLQVLKMFINLWNPVYIIELGQKGSYGMGEVKNWPPLSSRF